MFLTRRFYIVFAAVILLIGSGYWWSPLYSVGRLALAVFAFVVVADIIALYMKHGITAERHMAERFSNGDWNEVRIDIHNSYPFRPRLTVINEAPSGNAAPSVNEVSDGNDVSAGNQSLCGHLATPSPSRLPITTKPPRGATSVCRYPVALSAFSFLISHFSFKYRPTRRGVYSFGRVRVFASWLGFVERRFTCCEPQDVKVYPSYLMLRQYELLAISNRLTDLGIKRLRRIGHRTEFEQIRDYVAGDDFRTINWRATARSVHGIQVNVYQDERSQQIFSVIDKGRVMQQSFREMTLLDYAVNASLVLSYVAMRREDKAGLMTFSDRFDTYLPAQRSEGHMQTILENLYAQQTAFGETDYSALVDYVSRHVTKRSLLIVYTNFMTMVSMKRQLPWLLQLSHRHRVLVVFFQDEELQQYAASPAATTEDYYRHVVAEKTISDQRLIVGQLQRHGILSLLTTPDRLSVDIINKYLELKARQMLT